MIATIYCISNPGQIPSSWTEWQRRQKKGFIPATLVRCCFFPVSPVLKRNVWKKASHITSSSISVFVIQIQREAFFDRAAKNAKKRRPAEKVARSMHETDPSCVCSLPLIYNFPVFFLLFFFDLLYFSRCVFAYYEKGFPQTNFRSVFASQLIKLWSTSSIKVSTLNFDFFQVFLKIKGYPE